MNAGSNLETILSEVLVADGAQLAALASVVSSRLPFLRHVMRRQKTIRSDPRVLALGLGVDADAEAVLEKSLRLVGFLLREAHRVGHRGGETYEALAECLYELGADKALLAALADAATRGITVPRADKLRDQALLALDEPEAFSAFVGNRGAAGTGLSRTGLIDYRDFDIWAGKAGAELVTISEKLVETSGRFRFVTGEGIHEFDETQHSTPLRVAKLRNLEIYGGFLPVASGFGFYHQEAAHSITDAPMTAEVARNAFAHKSDARRLEIDGKHLIPCAPKRYFSQYSHGIVQIYARLVSAIRTGLFADHGVLLPETAPTWARRFLAEAGIDPGLIQTMPIDAISVVEEAALLPMKWEVCPWEIRSLRSALSRTHPYGTGRKRFYLTRRAGDIKNVTKVMVNEEEIIAVCEARGFTVIDPLEYSIEDQIALFADAGVIVTGDSSADTNMIHAPPGAEVVIIVPGRFMGMLMIDVAVSAGHTMSVVVGEYLADERQIDTSHEQPYRADPGRLEVLLDRILS